MARKPRADEFLINPARLTEDNDTLRLSLAQWGAYSRIFLRAWHQPEYPGVIVATDSVLASMAGATSEWPSLRTAIEPLFDTTSRPGFWVAHGMVETHEEQTAFIEAQRRKGILSGKARRAKRRNRGSSSVGTEVKPTPEPPTVLGARFSVSENLEPESKANPVTRAAPAFVRPSLAEVSAYCQERAASGHRQVDPQAWLDHYASNGWRVGRNPMRDWKAAVRTWERSGFENGNGQPTGDAAVSAWLKRQEAGRA